MTRQQPEPNDTPQDTECPEVPFGSSEIRLTPRQWLVSGIALAAVVWFAPVGWTWIERLNPGADYRIPYGLGHDYWMYNRYCRQVAPEDRTLLIGDSVAWGHYVAADETLSHYLNELAGEDRFANLGVDGIHPVAMAGLIDNYGRPIANKNVILHCNFLWMSSERHDLQVKKEFTFNHPELIPQFYPQIPCYRETTARRLGIVIGRKVPFLSWASHIRIAYFDGDALPEWTIDHPYANPASRISLELTSPNEPPSPVPVAKPWTEKSLGRFTPEWVDLETSLQWMYFCRTIQTFEQRGNRVFVLIGPFNEHMLTDEGLRGYRRIQAEAEAWLTANGVAYWTPSTLPSEYYADASHPLAEGYESLAKDLFENEGYGQFSSAGIDSSASALPVLREQQRYAKLAAIPSPSNASGPEILNRHSQCRSLNLAGFAECRKH